MPASRSVGAGSPLSSWPRRTSSAASAPTPSSWPQPLPITGQRPSPRRKIQKESRGIALSLELVRNPDILAGLTAAREGDPARSGQVIIGFGAETEPDAARLLELGRDKIARKGSDFLVLNRVGWSEGFATDGNSIVVINRAGDIVIEASGSKTAIADRILDLLS